MGNVKDKKTKHTGLLAIVRTASVIQKKSQAFFSAFDITDAQYNVMIVLKCAGESLSQVQISEQVVASRANVTALIDRLEKKKYVERKSVEGDRRVFHVELTANGRDLVDRVEPLYIQEVARAMKLVTLNECKMLKETLEKVKSSITL